MVRFHMPIAAPGHWLHPSQGGVLFTSERPAPGVGSTQQVPDDVVSANEQEQSMKYQRNGFP